MGELNHSELTRLAGINEDGCEGDISAGLLMLLEHQLVVHLVDVVARKDENVLGTLAADGINVLINGIGCALVPIFADALHGWQDLNELSELAGNNLPGFADVAIERECLVLREDIDPAQVGVNAVGKRNVDDSIDAAERNGRFSPVAGERIKSLACTTS